MVRELTERDKKVVTEVSHLTGLDLGAIGKVDTSDSIICRDSKGKRHVIVGYWWDDTFIARGIIAGKGELTWGPNGQAGKGKQVAWWEEGAVKVKV